MTVVADATPLHYLIIIGHSDILEKIFNRVVIPAAVASELRHPSTPEAVRAWISNQPGWLEERAATDSEAADLDRLGIGERQAILLAEQIRADWLIIDDRDGREAASRRNVPVVGTLRVLDEAAARRLIDVAEAIDRLQQTTFYVAPELFTWLKARDAARRRGE
jgi:predicted nucleic acid-binding protein